ncbi:MAG TPA: DNA methyltransferase [Candidatus Saccharimonadales bacterium]|nr:DNA methyltransferase [Candidatus Saccharimonadales bacterium]
MTTTKQHVTVPKSLVAAVSSRDKVTGAPHDFYRYPARFSPVFAREAIETFTEPGDFVLDPFCGGGTTLVEALSLGRRAAGMDVSSLAAFLARTKTTPISVHDKREIAAWVSALEKENPRKNLDSYEVVEGGTYYYLRNLPDEARAFFFWVRERLTDLPKPRQQQFVRLVLLGTGQWGLDCKNSVPQTAEFKTEFCRRLREAMGQFFDFASYAANTNGIPRCQLSSRRRVINRSSEKCGEDGRIPASWLPAKLVLTSPPYPGVHVVYHRWQIFGRKETPAPFWLANQRDGSGESHYLLGPRDEEALVTYYARLKSVFSSIRPLLDEKSIVVQLVAFSDPVWQLKAYLDTMREAGFVEAEAGCVTPAKIGGRIWREVPGRKWYANKRGEIPASKEVMLLHKLAT